MTTQTITNQQWVYRQRPRDRVGPEHYELVSTELERNPSRGEVLIQTHWFSVDPYMRIQQAARDTWDSPHPLDTVQGGGVIGRVLAVGEQVDTLGLGDWVQAYSGWQEYACVHQSGISRIDADDIPVQAYLGIMGMPGRTAWFGLMEAGRPHPGEVLVVSGAAGAVGSLVVQFGKRAGMQVIGVAGGQDKGRYVTQTLGADQVIDYRAFSDWQSLKHHIDGLCDGVDVFFDNVGGMIADAVIPTFKRRARMVVCGQISQYEGGLDAPALGPRFLQHLLFQRATITGILSRDFSHRQDEFLARVRPWLLAGEILGRETIIEGFERLPEALGLLFEGHNTGKLLVKATV